MTRPLHAQHAHSFRFGTQQALRKQSFKFFLKHKPGSAALKTACAHRRPVLAPLLTVVRLADRVVLRAAAVGREKARGQWRAARYMRGALWQAHQFCRGRLASRRWWDQTHSGCWSPLVAYSGGRSLYNSRTGQTDVSPWWLLLWQVSVRSRSHPQSGRWN